MKTEKRNSRQKETLIKVLKYIKPYRFLKIGRAHV